MTDRQQEAERAALAAELALENEGYAIERVGNQLAVTAGASRLLLRVTANGEIVIEAADGRAHAREADLIERSIARFRCRGLAELQHERAGATTSTGGERTPALRIAQLVEQRTELHVGRKVAFAAVAAGFVAAGVGVGSDAIWFHYRGCDSFGTGVECSAATVEALAIAGGTMVLAGGVMLAVALPRLLDALHRNRELGRELKLLRGAQLSMGAGSLRLGWGAAF